MYAVFLSDCIIFFKWTIIFLGFCRKKFVSYIKMRTRLLLSVPMKGYGKWVFFLCVDYVFLLEQLSSLRASTVKGQSFKYSDSFLSNCKKNLLFTFVYTIKSKVL